VALEEARQDSFDFLVCHLAHPQHKRQLLFQLVRSYTLSSALSNGRWGGQSEEQTPFTRSDLVLNCQQWSSFIVGKISSVLTDSNHPGTQKQAGKGQGNPQ
jgi:hypothetical protein